MLLIAERYLLLSKTLSFSNAKSNADAGFFKTDSRLIPSINSASKNTSSLSAYALMNSIEIMQPS